MNLRYVSLLQAVLSNRLLWLFLLVGFSALPALAQSTWTGATSTDWNTAGNWSGGTVPVVTDNVVIPPGPTNQPILSTSAVAKSVEVQSGASLSITAAGSLTINSSKNVSGFTTAFANRGNTWNAGQLVLGNTAAVGAGAIFNQGIFANAGGTIRVDRTSNQAINNNQGTFTNTGTIILGAVASVGSHGIFNLATFNNNNGEVRIDRSTEAGIRNQGSGASFTNSATITIGASFSAGARGLSNVNSATFSNNQGGTIQIDQTSQDGIQNAEGAVFTNSAMLVIGSLFGVGVNGVFSNATFSNNGGGVIRIDRSTENGIRNQGSGASFTNSAQITLGSSFGVGASGIFNLGNATFRNNAGGRITIDRTLFAAITNDAPFVNSATITTGALFSTGAYGIFNTASFTNNDGEIKIDRSANAGIGNFRNTASFINSARITIGSSFGVGGSGVVNQESAIFTNNPGGFITIDRVAFAGVENTASFTNAALIHIGTTAGAIGGDGLANTGTFSNSACATLTIFDNLNNGGSFTNDGLFTVRTTQPHANTALTNNGIIGYPLGNPIPNVTNNDLIALPISGSGNSISPALQVGSSNSFQVGTTWYKDEALTQPAGTYNQASNTFTATNLSPGSSTVLYFLAADGVNNCPRTVSVSVTVGTGVTAPFAITAVTTVNCTPIVPNRFSISFTPNYSGLNGQPVTFRVDNELLPTTEPGPYTLQLYSDNPGIDLRATQQGTSGEARFRYDWLAACQASEAPNTPPRVVNPIPPQSATVGVGYSYVIPQGTFTDDQTPGSLQLSATGLPPGIGLSGYTLSGVPSTTVGSPFSVTITATDPGNLTVNASFGFTVAPAPQTPPNPTQPFAITGVSMLTCTPIADRININFNPRYAGLNGQSIAFRVENELAPTNEPGPYSLTLYHDNPLITLKATQTGSVGEASFRYDWLAACTSQGQENTAPRVVNPVGSQTAVVGQSYGLSVANVFLDQETPNSLSLTVSGLPAGLSLVGQSIQGVASVTGVSTVILTATDPGSLSANTSFALTVSPASSTTATPPGGFTITGVQTLTCQVVSGGERRVTFQPQYSGVNGQPITVSVVNELAPTTNSGPYSLKLYTDNPVITLKASQGGSVGEASFAYNWLAGCNSGARLGTGEPVLGLSVVVLGNPVTADAVDVQIRGVAGQRLRVAVADERGYLVSEATRPQASSVERFRLKVGSAAGVYLLRVSTPVQSQTVKLIKAD